MTRTCSISRRSMLLAMSGLTVASLAGCVGDDESGAFHPISLTDGQTCAVCGMEIAAHFGPAVQAYYGGEDDPIAFDSVHEFLEYDAQQRIAGESLMAGFATDYSRVAYTVETVDGDDYISTHAAAEDFTALEELSFVIDSDIRGAMGSDAFPFSDPADADAFAVEFGGAVATWETLRDR